METRKILNEKIHFLIVVGIILAGAFARLIPHLPNFAPIGAMALFSGFYLKGYKAYAIPFGALFLSDLFLGFHETMPYVYVSFFIILFLGRLVQSRIKALSPIQLYATSLVGSCLFFAITNWGVWFATDVYEPTVNGLLQSYTMALPFFRNTILGDILYNTVFFYSLAWIEIVHYKLSKKVLV